MKLQPRGQAKGSIGRAGWLGGVVVLVTVEMVVVVMVRLKGSPGETARTRSDGWWPGAFNALFRHIYSPGSLQFM